jgi:hypothetical protein
MSRDELWIPSGQFLLKLKVESSQASAAAAVRVVRYTSTYRSVLLLIFASGSTTLVALSSEPVRPAMRSIFPCISPVGIAPRFRKTQPPQVCFGTCSEPSGTTNA